MKKWRANIESIRPNIVESKHAINSFNLSDSEFDERLKKLGTFVTDEEMRKQTKDTVIGLERQLGPLKETDSKVGGKTHNKGPFRYHADRSIYKGNWNSDLKKHGFGVLVKEDGSKYEGGWENDEQSGYGRYFDIKGNYFVGYWKNGKANGDGLLCIDRSKFDGTWQNDVQIGKGSETFEDGSRYEGSYERGCKHGQGKFTWPDKSCYDGQFHNGMITGKGTFKWHDGRQYEGSWLNNKMEGEGKFTYADKSYYIGQYKADKKHGKGKYFWNADKYYDGEWFNNKQHGDGIIVTNGKKKDVTYRFGKRIKDSETKEERIDLPAGAETNNEVFYNQNHSVKDLR
jgi:hypothetical protein